MFLEIRLWSTGSWGGTGDPSKSKSPLALPVLGNPKASCHSTSLDSSFLRHDRTYPAASPCRWGLDWRRGDNLQVSAFGSHVQNQSFPERGLGKGCNPTSPCRSSHHRVVLAPRGFTHPFLKHLQTPKSNLVLLPGADGE